MCGRYTLFAARGDVESAVDATFEDAFEPRYNAAPGQDLPVVADRSPDAIERMEWGLVPSWADDRSAFEFVNARAETLAGKPSFAAAFERDARARGGDDGGPRTAGRCLVPADGFYEWTDAGGGKRPYRVTMTDERPFAMAGLWARWTPPQHQTGLDAFGGGTGGRGDSAGGPTGDPDPVETFAVVTTDPNDLVADLHDRMAVILDPDEAGRWLRADPDEAATLLDPYPAAEMRAYPVSTAVNDPTNETPALVEEADGAS